MDPNMFPPGYHSAILRALEETALVPGITPLNTKIQRLLAAVADSERSGEHPGSAYVELDGALFEFRTIRLLNRRSSIHSLRYEPEGVEISGKRIDLSFEANGLMHALELKSTNPQSVQRRIPHEKFSANTLFTNELYYGWLSSARSHLVEFLYDTEQKLANYRPFDRTILAIYENFFVEEDELFSLWWYYRNQTPFAGDALGRMMAYEAKQKNFRFNLTIDELWGLPFSQFGFDFRNGERLTRLRDLDVRTA